MVGQKTDIKVSGNVLNYDIPIFNNYIYILGTVTDVQIHVKQGFNSTCSKPFQ